jgi:hypothetical protein
MNLASILITPWRSARAPVRWVMCAFLFACVVAAMGMLVFMKDRNDAISSATNALGFGMIYVWAFFLSHTLLLALDARDLRIPRLNGTITVSLVVYAIVCIALPTLALAMFGAPMAGTAVIMALCVLGGLLFAWLPRYFSVTAAFVPMLMIRGRQMFDIPGPTRPEFMSWALPLAIVLLLALLFRLRQLMRTRGMLEQGMRSPMVMQFRRCGTSGWGTIGGAFSNEALSRQPAWMQARADLRKVGPHTPLPAIRVALGGFYMPKTWQGVLLTMAQFSVGLLIIGFIVTMISLEHRISFYTALTTVGLPITACGATFGTAAISVATIARFTQRWRKTNTELPLLALMPGLGDAGKMKREFLRVSLTRPMAWQAGFTVVLIAGSFYMHVGTAVTLAIAAAQLGCMAVLPAILLRVLGGQPVRSWRFAAGTTLMFLLLNANCVLPILAKDIRLHPNIDYIALAIAALWVMIGLVVVYLGRAGWLSLRERPHAFLANS